MTDPNPPVHDPRRTGPELRDVIQDATLEARRKFGDDPVFETIFAALVEMPRRSPKYKVARKRDPDPTPEQVRRIRSIKFADEELPHTEIARMVGVGSTRCVSLALVGRRDGRPLFDANGEKIKYPRKERAPRYDPLTGEPI